MTNRIHRVVTSFSN